jgi:hypothetical protein
MYDILKETKLRAEQEMFNHDRASTAERMLNYSGKGFTNAVDPEWNRPNPSAPKPRYTLSLVQLRRMQRV